MQPKSIAILAYPEATAAVIYGLYDLFRGAGRDWGFIVDGKSGDELLNPLIVARSAGTIEIMNGIPLTPHGDFHQCPVPDVVCVGDLNVEPEAALGERFAPEVAWLRHCYQAGATIATVCSGSVLLAEAGLLDGCEATSHWAYCDVLRSRYPKVQVRPQRALVASGEGHRLLTAGGGTTWLDLALVIIARLAGAEAAMQVAKMNLINWHEAGQQPYARLARTRQVDDAEIARCQVWIAQHYATPSPVAAMLALSGLAERSFKRRFEQATGMAPLAYVQTVRLEEAKQMLEASDEAVEAIANSVGYEDAAFFSRLFRRSVSMTPAQYRRRFRSLRTSLHVG
jgi:transcriptional regulator GlxA family with amidase domain